MKIDMLLQISYYCLKGESTSSIEMKTTYSCNMKALRSSCYEFYTT